MILHFRCHVHCPYFWAAVNAFGSSPFSGSYDVGTNISFTCSSEYNLIGSSFSSCQTNGSWNPPPPTCRQGNEINKQ